MTPLPKPTKRVKRGVAFQREVLQRDTRCAVCGGRAEQGHHLLKRSQGGDDVRQNGIGLCLRDHRAVEDHKINLTLKDLPDESVEYLREKGQTWRFEQEG